MEMQQAVQIVHLTFQSKIRYVQTRINPTVSTITVQLVSFAKLTQLTVAVYE